MRRTYNRDTRALRLEIILLPGSYFLAIDCLAANVWPMSNIHVPGDSTSTRYQTASVSCYVALVENCSSSMPLKQAKEARDWDGAPHPQPYRPSPASGPVKGQPPPVGVWGGGGDGERKRQKALLVTSIAPSSSHSRENIASLLARCRNPSPHGAIGSLSLSPHRLRVCACGRTRSFAYMLSRY